MSAVMTPPVAEFRPGSLVTARGREWVVLPEGGGADRLRLRPLGGAEDDATIIYLPLEPVPPRPATFPPPDPDKTGARREFRRNRPDRRTRVLRRTVRHQRRHSRFDRSARQEGSRYQPEAAQRRKAYDQRRERERQPACARADRSGRRVVCRPLAGERIIGRSYAHDLRPGLSRVDSSVTCGRTATVVLPCARSTAR